MSRSCTCCRHDGQEVDRGSPTGREIRAPTPISAVNDRHLTIRALEMALKRRYPDAGRLLHHSDQGRTYASENYQDVLDAHGIT